MRQTQRRGHSQDRSIRCKRCGALSGNLYLCSWCGDELHALLVGDKEIRGQPGIGWYIGRLREQAYGQARLGQNTGTRSTREGYALLANSRAIDLLDRITGTLGNWVAHLTSLSATLSHEWASSGMTTAGWLARHVRELRRQENSAVLLVDLLAYAKEAWKIINRPADNCCGPCPSTVNDEGHQGKEIPCGTLLYAEEKATVVQCPRCRKRHNVEALRESLRNAVRDMLFTAGELRKLMDTRLNDRMPKATFYKMIQDGRLVARCTADDGVKMYTYNDVCVAREKPSPTRKVSAK